MRIVILGYIVRGPLGGLAWHHLQYVIGLESLGHEVLFVEDSDDYVSCYNPLTDQMTGDPQYGLNFIQEVFASTGIRASWAYHDSARKVWYGMPSSFVEQYCSTSDLLISLSGVNPWHPYFIDVPVRVLIDTDPCFYQVRNLTEPAFRKRSVHFTHFFSFGENLGQDSCLVPDDELPWMPTRQPVVCSHWKLTTGNLNSKWTTVMQFDSYESREYKGIRYGMKSASFPEFLHLPELTGEPFELALSGEAVHKKRLTQAGWNLSDPLFVSRSPESYQQYIRQSKAEWSVAKQGYVVSDSGWFSERSACYLASGRPVLVQDTGFTKQIETGSGLLAFRNLAECRAGIESINSHYDQHCNWAREIAESYFDHRKVLSRLLDQIN